MFLLHFNNVLVIIIIFLIFTSSWWLPGSQTTATSVSRWTTAPARWRWGWAPTLCLFEQWTHENSPSSVVSLAADGLGLLVVFNLQGHRAQWHGTFYTHNNFTGEGRADRKSSWTGNCLACRSSSSWGRRTTSWLSFMSTTMAPWSSTGGQEWSMWPVDSVSGLVRRIVSTVIFTLLTLLTHVHSVLHRHGQHLHPHRDVFLLWPGGHRPSHAEVPVVEAIPHLFAAGECGSELWREYLSRKLTCVRCGSRSSSCCFSFTPATTSSQTATSLTPWMLWCSVTASRSSSSLATFIIRATSRKRKISKMQWWDLTQTSLKLHNWTVVYLQYSHVSTRGNNMTAVLLFSMTASSSHFTEMHN